MTTYGFNQEFTRASIGASAGGGWGGGFTRPVAAKFSDSLVLKYDIGNPASYSGTGYVVTDIAGNSNGTLINSPSYTPGYLAFDGLGQYLTTDADLSPQWRPGVDNTDVVSVVMWAYPMDNGVLLSERNASGITSGWHESQIEMVSGTLKIGTWSTSNSIVSITSSVATPLNVWYHICLSYDGSTLHAYVNGQAAGSVTYSRSNPIENGNSLFYTIAGPDTTSMGDGTYAKMRLGSFSVYKKALAASEVTQDFSDTKSSYGL